MAFVRALQFVARLAGVIVGTIVWIVGVPIVEFARGLLHRIRVRGGSFPSESVARDPESASKRATRGPYPFDPTRVRPIWTARQPRPRKLADQRSEPPADGEEREAS